MFTYKIGILTLIKRLKLTYPDTTQPWYTYDSGALSTLKYLEKYFNLLKCNGPDQGYYTNSTKIIMIVNLSNI